MSEMRKITALIPADTLQSALRETGEGVSETLRRALRDFNHRAASRRLLAARATVRFDQDWRELRGKDEA